MKKETNIKEFKRMHEELTDPEKLEEAKQIYDREKRIENNKKDTGL